MANPILHKNDAFTARPMGASGDPYAAQYGQPGFSSVHVPQPAGAAMTLDDVIAKTGITMGVLLFSAVASFMFLDMSTTLVPALIASSIVGFVAVMFVSMRKVVNPALVLFYALVEGVFIGGFTKMFEVRWPGIAAQAVIGTFAAAAAVLAAYKYLNVRVTNRMRRVVMVATFASCAVMLVDFVLALFGIDTGLRDHGFVGLLVAIVFAGVAAFNLLVDFDDISRGIANNAPATESWRAAFGVTVTMVWLYTEVLRILSYFQRN